MTSTFLVPKLITFDGEARTGKGTIVKRTKLRLESDGLKVKHIDRGQIFRALAVCAQRQSIDFDDPSAIDFFLSHEDTESQAVELLNKTAHMPDEERESLLYTPIVSERCAKLGARSQSQAIAKHLCKLWVKSAKGHDDIVLLDGRALEHLGRDYASGGDVEYVLGLYFICDEWVGAKRYLGYAATADEDLSSEQRVTIEDMVLQIKTRNNRDFDREVEALARPNVPIINLPDVPTTVDQGSPTLLIIDTSADMTKQQMASFPIQLVERSISSS